MPTRLTFTPGNHSYWLADQRTGKRHRITSVTTLLNMEAKPALVKWAANAAAEYAVDNWESLCHESPSKRLKAISAGPDHARDTAAAKGTAIHAMAERLLAGEPVEAPADLAAKVEGLARWWERAGVARVAAERMVWSEEDPDLDACAYAGTFDLLVDCPRRGLGLLDFKTGKGVWGEAAVQLAAYAAAATHVTDGEDTPAPVVAWLGVLHVAVDGTTLHTVPADVRSHATTRFNLLRALKTLPAPQLVMEA